MKSVLRYFALGAASLLCLGGLRAQTTPPVTETVTVGGLTTTAAGQTWAYLFWQTDSMELLNARSYSVWQKAGDATSAAPFARVGIVNLQTDPSAVSAVIDRATLALGEDPVALDQTITGLFQNLMPTLSALPPGQRLAAKVSAVLRGVTADPRQLQSLVLASRYHPSIALAIGQAFSAKIPASGPVTFEVREYQPSTKTDVAVIGRVTLDNAAPVALPVPTMVHQVPDSTQQGFNNLNVKLVWDTPDALRRLRPLTQGFNLFRVKRSTAVANGWQNSAPAASILAGMAGVPGSNVGRVNRAAISPAKVFSAAEVLTTVPGDQFFVDDVSRMPGYPTTAVTPKNGDQYYYFVTSRDALGRDNVGAASAGLLATFCDRVMPDVPAGLKVTNEYGYNGGASKQFLRLTWKANDNSGAKKTTGYLVYRWSAPDGPLAPTGNPPLPVSRDPLANLVAGPIPHVAGQATFSYDDTGVGSPATPADLNRTYWYTVRSVDNGAFDAPPGGPFCDIPPFGGNISANSPSAYGTLRNRVGPAAPTPTVSILCPVPGITAGQATRVIDNTLDPNQRYIELIATRPAGEENLEAVDFELQSGATWTPLGRFHFAPGDTSTTFRWTTPPGAVASPAVVRARALASNGDVSSYAQISISVPPALSISRGTWTLSIAYTRVPLTSVTGGAPRCTTHTPPNPGSGVVPPNGNGIVIDFFPPAGTRQYKLYYRLDNGPQTLAKEDSQNFTPGQLLQVLFDVIPAATSQVCLFLQIFDIDGNPSPMTPLGCFLIKGSAALAKPMLAPIASTGAAAAPTADIQWFCPPVGVDHFEVWVSSSPNPLASALSPVLNQDAANPAGTSQEKAGQFLVNYTYQRFNTERVGPLFGSGSIFSVSVPVSIGQTLRVKVRAVSEGGDHGGFSNVETYTWTPPPGFQGPDVPWPARALPGMGDVTKFSGPLTPTYFPVDGVVGVLLGQATLNSRGFSAQGRTVIQLQTTQAVETFLFTADFKNPDVIRNALPCVLYRTQIPDAPNPPGKPLANYPSVPGDVVQVSPLLESISVATEAYPGGGTGISIYDPFIYVNAINFAGTRLNQFYLKDTTPVLSGARYLYLLVLLDPDTHEISRVLPLAPIDIP